MSINQRTPPSQARDLDAAHAHDLFGRYTEAANLLDDLISAARSEEALSSSIVVAALARRASLYRYAGDLDAAHGLLAEAERLVGTSETVDPAHACELHIELGRLALEMAGPDAADGHLDRAVELVRSLPTHARGLAEADALAALGASRRVRGDYDAAEALLLEAVRHAGLAVDTNPGDRRAAIELVHVLDELGVLYKFSGDFQASETAYGRALTLLEARAGPDHPDAATIQHNLGGLAHARGDGAAAEAFARRAVELHERSLGADHLATVLDRSALAAVLDQQGASTEAETLLRDCAERLERTLGASHRELAVVLNNLAAIAQRAGRLDDAHDLYVRTAAIKERVIGPQSPSLAITLNNLATVQRHLGRVDDAATNYARALEILLRSAGPDHPHVGVIRRNLARLGTESQDRVSDS